MILVHAHTDYYGPQLLGIYSSLEQAEQAIKTHANIDSVQWSTDYDTAHTFVVQQDVYVYFNVVLDAPLLKVNGL